MKQDIISVIITIIAIAALFAAAVSCAVPRAEPAEEDDLPPHGFTQLETDAVADASSEVSEEPNLSENPADDIGLQLPDTTSPGTTPSDNESATDSATESAADSALESPPGEQASSTNDTAQPAADLTDDITITLSDGRNPAVLLDRDYTTQLTFGQGAAISLTGSENISSLYIVWSLPPGEWSVSDAETRETASARADSQVFGQNGFIHEFITLDTPADDLLISLPQDGARLCDIYAFSEGAPPEWVQIWQPPHRTADLLVFPTHADDEHLFFVGILPYYAGERGLRVQVAYMTNHWNEPPRPHELLNGLWAVGIRNYPIISDFNDRYAASLEDAKSIYGFDNFIDYQTEQLRRFKPYVVVGHDLNGEYGHGVHSLAAHALLQAVENAAELTLHPESYEKYGAWNTPKLYLHLYRENAIMMDWDIPLEFFDGATAYEMAVRGYDAHKSQHRWSFSVPKAGSVSGHRFGLVRSLFGPDTLGGDLFENLTPNS